MDLIWKILLGVLAVLLLIMGGLLIWYYFVWLAKPQLFLVSRPYTAKWMPSSADVTALTTAFSGTWATQAQLQQAAQQGMLVNKAGYLSDLMTPNPACSPNTCTTPPCTTVPPAALYTQAGGKLGNSCSQGYFIIGKKTGTAPVGFTVEPWNPTKFNVYQVSSFADFWAALTKGQVPLN